MSKNGYIFIFFHSDGFVRSPVGAAHHCHSTAANSRLMEQSRNNDATSTQTPTEGATVVSKGHFFYVFCVLF